MLISDVLQFMPDEELSYEILMRASLSCDLPPDNKTGEIRRR